LTSDIRAQIDSCLFARNVPGLGTVLIPKKHVSVQSSLLSVLDNDQLREAAEEVLESESLEDVFSPFLSKTPFLAENPNWIVECLVTDSMVSGSWGLKAFVLGERGYIYTEPDWGTGDPSEDLPILAAWDPVGVRLAFRTSFLYTYKKYWNRIGLPPSMGQWAVGPIRPHGRSNQFCPSAEPRIVVRSPNSCPEEIRFAQKSTDVVRCLFI
jgi:hypothetical protein